jgi:hypothetical protein
VNDLTAVKTQYQVPLALQSCHTAIVDGYVIEGHVPVAEIDRLLNERPDVAGLAVPGMPVGSPGMVVEGAADEPYDVIAFDKAGNTELYASYGQ